MSHVQNKLQLRAKTLARIREFFAARNVLEVQTPLLAPTTVTDLHIDSIATVEPNGFLQTSPEYAMKCLLAEGSGCIYQTCKAFRQGEKGARHNPEFTLLEWYRVGFDHHQLMAEVDELLQAILNTQPAEKITYRDLFIKHLDIDPFIENIDHDYLISHKIEPLLGFERPLFIYDYPTDQAALAKIRDGNPRVAERFELYANGIELANGYHELNDASEQRLRFENDLQKREAAGKTKPVIDQSLLAALDKGLPDCAGVALGLDRLLMLASGNTNMSEVLAIQW